MRNKFQASWDRGKGRLENIWNAKKHLEHLQVNMFTGDGIMTGYERRILEMPDHSQAKIKLFTNNHMIEQRIILHRLRNTYK